MTRILTLILLLIYINGYSQVRLFGISFGAKKVWWYREQVINIDGDPVVGFQSIDSLFQKTQPEGYVRDRPALVTNTDCDDLNANIYPGQSEVCNFIDDNCNNIADEGFQHYAYYIDDNGDGFGDDANQIYFCDDVAPSGYTTQSPVVPDIVLYPTGRSVNKSYWLFNFENLVYDGRVFSFPLTGTLNTNIVGLSPNGFMYPGSVTHYLQYQTSDTVTFAPRGYNSISTTNKLAGYGAAWTQSAFPTAVKLASQTGGGLLLQSSPVKDCNSLLSQINWMKRQGVEPLGFLVDQEYSDANWVDCANCGNGDAVAADGSFWFGCVSGVMQDAAMIIDGQYDPTARIKPGSYASKILTTVGYNSQRFYWAPSKGAKNITSTLTAEQIADSFDYAIDVKLPQIISSSSISGYCTSLYPEDIDPRGGRLPTAGSWANNYFVVKSYIRLMQLETKGIVFGRLDLLDVKLNQTNNLYDCLKMIKPFFRSDGDYFTVAGTYGEAIAVVNNRHGYIITAQRSGDNTQARYISINGYIVPVLSITGQTGRVVNDTAPVISDQIELKPLSINLITF